MKHWLRSSALKLSLSLGIPLSLVTTSWSDTIISNVGAPADSNPNIPVISAGVVLSPAGPTPIDGVATGPINGQTFGPDGYANSVGGTTGFITTRFVLTEAAENYQITFEVSDVGDTSFPAGLAIDNIRLTTATGTTVLFGFEGAGLPGGFTSVGSSFFMSSPAIPNLSPTEGNQFGYIDTASGSQSPIFDTVAGTNGSRLLSAIFAGAPGDVLEVDLAFLSSDSTLSFPDYGIASLHKEGESALTGVILFTADTPSLNDITAPQVPEPASIAMSCASLVGLLGYALRRYRAAKAA